MAVPMVSSAEGITFGGFKRVSFVSRGRCGTSWLSDIFFNVWKIVLCGRRNTFATFSEDVLQFSWQAQHFGRVHIVILRGRRSTLDVSCCVFLRIALSGLRQVATKCRFRGRRGILWDVMKIDRSLPRNIDFEATKCQNWRKSRTKCLFFCPHVSRLESLVFLWRRRVYGGACDKVVCDRWCVTKLCERWSVKHGVWKMVCVCVRVWKMVCDKVVCERLCKRWCVKVSSASLLIPLQTILLRTPTDAAHRWASDPYSFHYACLLYVLQFFQGFLPAISSFSQRCPRFPWFSKRFFQACHSCFPPRYSFFTSFLHFPIFLHFLPVFNSFPSFSLVFSYLFPSVFKGPRENRTPPSPNCLVAHAPLKISNWPP